MKIAILTHYYLPETGAPQARLSEMAREWIRLGHQVTVVTCFPNHPTGIIPEEYRGKKYMEEIIDGVTVCRCMVYATPNKGVLKKTLGHLSFMASSVLQGHGKVKGSDVIVVSSPTFFSVISAWFLSKIYRIPYVFDVRDLWPAIFVDLGIIKNKLIIGILEKIELFLYDQSAGVVAVTHSFAKNISDRGISPDKVHVITNGVDLQLFTPRPRDIDICRRYKLDDKFIVMYMGAHGISHALKKIIKVAEELKHIPDIQFVFVGDGAEKVDMEKEAALLQLNNVTFISSQPKNMVPAFYSIMDVGLVPLRDIPLFETFIPSKMFEIMAMGKPIVASVRGEAAGMLKDSGAALICNPEDVSAIGHAIRQLYNDRSQLDVLGNNGRQFVKQKFSREYLAGEYEKILNMISGRGVPR